jgi:hypothetical protein
MRNDEATERYQVLWTRKHFYSFSSPVAPLRSRPRRFAASSAGGPAAAAGRVVLVWATTEPFALSEPLHAGHNRNITQINAEARQVGCPAPRAGCFCGGCLVGRAWVMDMYMICIYASL